MASDIGVILKTPLEDGMFYVRKFEGTEYASRAFEFRLQLFSANAEVDFKKLIGQPVTMEITGPDGEVIRAFSGVTSRFGQAPFEGRYAVYDMVMVPWLWLLSRNAGCDIYNEVSTQEIVKTVLKRAAHAEFELVGSGWSDRLYCVQYRESDLDFVSRILEEEGFYWFFESTGDSHKMIVADGDQTAATVVDVKFASADSGDEATRITEFTKVQELTTGAYEMIDFEYSDPKLGEPVESVPSAVDLGSSSNETKWYDFPAEFGKMTAGDTGKLRERVKTRMAEEDSRAIVFRGKSKVYEIAAGHGITLAEAYREDLDGDYLITQVKHTLSAAGGLEAGEGGGEFSYDNEFECVPDGIRYVPPRRTPKPKIRGVHTAVVKEAIDGKARVRVAFPWCKDKLSCWIRVAQTLAGATWGAQFHPRVGHELVIDFYEGDPDLPVAVGRVYNGENEGPYAAKHSRGGIKTRSMDGGADNFNEIRFEDEKGSEELFIHAEKDKLIEVENNETKEIGANRAEKVGKNVSIKIGGDRTETVDGARGLSVGGNKTEAVTGEKSISVSKGHTETITADMKLDVGQMTKVNVGKDLVVAATGAITMTAGAALTVSAKKETSITSTGACTIKVEKGTKLEIKEEWGAKAKKILIEAEDELTIKVGKATFTMKKNGDVLVDGKAIDVKGSGDVKIKGSKTAVQ